ncbi:hypothetical protein [Chryseobacterium sp. MP_3.2]|uniref:hypothetical protein n=1 Tax=Chryseobacterium sp. MP_3.2 TaxID=3071712 RepID=UPI002E00D4EE|nr:hypothetical protein [Chryseobacterium sp. MP_3.2]
MSEPYFLDIENGNNKVWELYSKLNNNKLEKRIKNAVEWTGKALKDENNAKALIQFIFAIECILHIDTKNIINPSILSQISDNIAFLLSEDFDQRKIIASSFKDLYIKRSGIVHGSSQEITS